MSEGQSAGPAVDPVKELARSIYIVLAGNTYAGAAGIEGTNPDPVALGRLAFRLADAFNKADQSINFEAIAAAKARDTFTADDLDLGSIVMTKPAPPPAGAAGDKK